jgi:hypothetical protein
MRLFESAAFDTFNLNVKSFSANVPEAIVNEQANVADVELVALNDNAIVQFVPATDATITGVPVAKAMLPAATDPRFIGMRSVATLAVPAAEFLAQ